MRRKGGLAIAVLVMVCAVLIGGRGGRGIQAAQSTDGSPTAMGEQMTETAHPAHIHSGTCATLGDVVFPLTDVAAPETMGTPAADMAGTPEAMMASPEAGMGDVVAQSTTTVEASLADIVAGGHAINVHESAENIGNYIACGDITGTPTDNALEIDLAELNGSGYEGHATLTDNGDGTTMVAVWLTHTSTEDGGTPTA